MKTHASFGAGFGFDISVLKDLFNFSALLDKEYRSELREFETLHREKHEFILIDFAEGEPEDYEELFDEYDMIDVITLVFSGHALEDATLLALLTNVYMNCYYLIIVDSFSPVDTDKWDSQGNF